MSSVRLDIAYEGGGFRGWAVQPGERTVQGELETALATVLRGPVALTVAGRTDAGVHAWGQVASFEMDGNPPADLARRLNGVCPDDIAVLAAGPAPPGFDARRDARSRTYCYRVLARPAPSPFERGRALWWPHPLDRGALAECAAAIVGSHDFTAFTPTQTDHIRFERRVLGAEWTAGPEHPAPPGPPPEEVSADEPLLCFWVRADAFMRSMVRVLVGTMLEVAGGRREVADFAALLEGAPRERAGDTAPAHGLYLASVSFGEREGRP
ncbi:MAG: tRNA pseudouridine(38-40) synthase TruA [Solirubrobacterales bacterium]